MIAKKHCVSLISIGGSMKNILIILFSGFSFVYATDGPAEQRSERELAEHSRHLIRHDDAPVDDAMIGAREAAVVAPMAGEVAGGVAPIAGEAAVVAPMARELARTAPIAGEAARRIVFLASTGHGKSDLAAAFAGKTFRFSPDEPL